VLANQPRHIVPALAHRQLRRILHRRHRGAAALRQRAGLGHGLDDAREPAVHRQALLRPALEAAQPRAQRVALAQQAAGEVGVGGQGSCGGHSRPHGRGGGLVSRSHAAGKWGSSGVLRSHPIAAGTERNRNRDRIEIEIGNRDRNRDRDRNRASHRRGWSGPLEPGIPVPGAAQHCGHAVQLHFALALALAPALAPALGRVRVMSCRSR
jgi:hypothetical protein